MLPVDLEQEAVRITEDLGKVVFIGAMAVNHYTKFRGTRDIDLIAASPPSEEKMIELGYRKREGSRNSWYTPRGIQADFYTRDVGRIPVEWIVKTATPAIIGRKTIWVMSLEALIIAKHRAGRSQDIADLRQLMSSRSRDIRWDMMNQIGTDLEISELRQVARALES